MSPNWSAGRLTCTNPLGKSLKAAIVIPSVAVWLLGYHEHVSFPGSVMSRGSPLNTRTTLWFRDSPAVKGCPKLRIDIMKVMFSAPWAVGKLETVTLEMVIVLWNLDSVSR